MQETPEVLGLRYSHNLQHTFTISNFYISFIRRNFSPELLQANSQSSLSLVFETSAHRTKKWWTSFSPVTKSSRRSRASREELRKRLGTRLSFGYEIKMLLHF